MDLLQALSSKISVSDASTTGCSLFIGSVLLASLLGLRAPSNAWLPGIPIQDSNSALGLTNFTQHKVCRQMLKEKGPLVQFKVAGQKVLFIADKTIARAVLRDIHGKGYPFHNITPKLVPDNTFSLDTGPEWTKRRSAFRKAFSTTCLKAHIETVKKMSDRLVDYLNAHISTDDKKEIVTIVDAFIQLTVGIICEVAFEMNVNAFDENLSYATKLHQALKNVTKLIWVRFLPFATYLYNVPIYPFSAYKNVREKYLAEMRAMLQHMQRLSAAGKLQADSLAQAVVNFAALPGVEEKDVLAEIGVFFIAGMDTTAHTMSFFIYCLAKWPDVQRRCQEEADKYDAATANANMLPPYIEATLKECMRKYPVAAPGSMRQVKQEEGYRINEHLHLPKGWWVIVNFLSLHNYEANWGPDAVEFRPERWMDAVEASIDEVDPLAAADNSNASNSQASSSSSANPLSSAAVYGGVGQSHNDLIFAPFSYGIRNCVGMNLGLMELRVTILALLKNFNFTLADESMLINDDNMLETSFILKPQKGLPVYVSKRE